MRSSLENSGTKIVVHGPDVSVDGFDAEAKMVDTSKRARRRWRLLRNVHEFIRRTSLTASEAKLLESLNKAKNANSSAGKNHIEDGPVKVHARMRSSRARDRLRHSIAKQTPYLSGAEAQFLEALVELEDQDDDVYDNAARVLESDDLYAGGGAVCADEKAEEFVIVLPESTPRLIVGNEDTTLRKELWKTRPSSFGSCSRQLPDDVGPLTTAKYDVEKPQEQNKDTFSSYILSCMDCGLERRVSSALVEEDVTARSDKHAEKGGVSSELVEVDLTSRSHKHQKKGGKKFSPVPFSILGIDEDSTQDYVLSPPLMDAITEFLPYVVQQDNFWLKYSLARDGASLDVLLSSVRSSSRTIIAIETMEGEVFGSFTSDPWRHKGRSYYGSGESFLWRLRGNRRTHCSSTSERVTLESDVEVFKWSGKNRNIQQANQKHLIVGGGEPDEEIDRKLQDNSDYPNENVEWGFGIALNSDLSSGTSGKCATFDSPELSKLGDVFSGVSNVEIWTMTPLSDIEQAEKLELGRQFVFSHVIASA